MKELNQEFDAIIIGSGFGGSMTAKKLVDAGKKVLMLERGDWVVRGPQNWEKNGSIDLSPFYDKKLPYKVIKGGNKPAMGVYSCVGGPSVFYGGVSFRFREDDFNPPQEIIGDSGAQWPITYADLSTYYDEAENLLNIAGESGVDPTEPHRIQEFPQKPGRYAKISEKVKSAAEGLGLKPFHLPIAINYQDITRNTCQNCTTCDTFACAVEAKNDLPTMLLSGLVKKGMVLRANTIVAKLNTQSGKVNSLSCFDTKTGEQIEVKGRQIILSAGALASPHILLGSELDKLNPAGDVIGRYLMRHTNSIVFGIYAGVADKEQRFHKELAILDYYFGHETIAYPKQKLGSLQQVPTPPGGLVEHEAPWPLGKVAAMGVKLLTGLLAIAEDQPQFENYLRVDHSNIGAFNMPTPIVSHEYSNRDMAALKALTLKAKKIMKKTGAVLTYTHNIKTFSHAVGTVRMGINEKTSALDANCNFRGLDNLSVVDGSFMPTSAAVNPSLTISANALRVGDYLLQNKF